MPIANLAFPTGPTLWNRPVQLGMHSEPWCEPFAELQMKRGKFSSSRLWLGRFVARRPLDGTHLISQSTENCRMVSSIATSQSGQTECAFEFGKL